MPAGEEPPAPAIDLPASFGKYYLTEKLATGGMAEIYLAKLVGPGGFEKQLVIKQIHPRLSGQRHFVDLFVAEAKTLVTLTHGNIVPVYELGVIDETYFIAMEYIDGPTLYRLTERVAQRSERMAPHIAAWITARILEGLDYAHRKGDGVIHRDLSPRNVMLSRDGEVKLVDFGIAITRGTDDTTVEQSAPTGSFPYMSPEQVRREPLSGQTDLFSVGVLMWEMLVGARLFARPTADDTLAAVTTTDIEKPSAIHPEIPPKLDEVVMRALERDMTVRWESAADMLAALQRYLYALDVTPGPRDVSALVAQFCPPETRRLPTHVDALPADSPFTEPGDTPVPAGPNTAVIPRDKKLPRQQTFATHVDMQSMLDRATPLFPISAIDDGTPPPKPIAAKPAEAPSDEPDDDEPIVRRPRTEPRARRSDDAIPFDRGSALREPPSRMFLVLGGIGASILAVGAILVFLKGRASVLAPDAAPRRDAAWYALEHDDGSMPDAPPDAPADAPEDAAVPIDAGAPTRDSGFVRVPHDAVTREPPKLDAQTARPGATGTLKIGAIPWAEIVIDGVPRGRTPADDLSVPAGHHVVELIFRGDDPPKTHTFQIEVAPNGAVPLQWDFSRDR